MTKADLVNAIAEESGLSKKDSEKSLNAALNAITNGLKKGEKVQLVGFGTFEVRNRAERPGKNPQTGAAMTIAASKAPAFKAGKALKDAIAE
jgi:DNA-binding protein HU-beta